MGFNSGFKGLKVFRTNKVLFGTGDMNMFLSSILKSIKKIHVFPKNRGMAKRKYLGDLEIVTRILNVT